MPTAWMNPNQLLDSLQWRYAVKKFDPTRQIDSTTLAALEKALVLAPSSFGLQPWKFVVVSSPEMKAKLPAISWNQSQPGDCSHMVVFAAAKTMSEKYVDDFLSLVATKRNVDVSTLAGYRGMIVGFMKNLAGRELSWSSNQVYLALGQLLTAAAALGIDACPMEGIVGAEYDKLLGLANTNYTTVVGCALGYRHADDKYALAPKVRFESDAVLVRS
jgi:nitroreductase